MRPSNSHGYCCPIGINTRVNQLQFPVILHFLLSIHSLIYSPTSFQFQFLPWITQTIGTHIRELDIRHKIVTHPQFTIRNSFTSHHDNPVSRLITVDSRCRSILQHIDTLNIKHIHIIQSFQSCFHSIHDNQWRVQTILVIGSLYRSRTPDNNLRDIIRIRTLLVIIHDSHSRHKHGQRLEQIRLRNCKNIFGTNRGYRSRVTIL